MLPSGIAPEIPGCPWLISIHSLLDKNEHFGLEGFQSLSRMKNGRLFFEPWVCVELSLEKKRGCTRNQRGVNVNPLRISYTATPFLADLDELISIISIHFYPRETKMNKMTKMTKMTKMN